MMKSVYEKFPSHRVNRCSFRVPSCNLRMCLQLLIAVLGYIGRQGSPSRNVMRRVLQGRSWRFSTRYNRTITGRTGVSPSNEFTLSGKTKHKWVWTATRRHWPLDIIAEFNEWKENREKRTPPASLGNFSLLGQSIEHCLIHIGGLYVYLMYMCIRV
ncbi:hypothetical protein M8J76_010699 [Diaphorina citri]|nr:hypothetical protein M8J75_002191 [Diaphorina citri]KAI5716692.1 hypothetical protein M8J76_010699 [Diaphorina citri]